MGEVAGVSNARQGQIETREAVANTEREVTQSSHITEYWFSEHEQTKLRCMEVLLETAKIAWSDKHNKKVQHVLDDGSTVLFQIDDQFTESEYGLQITNGAKSFELIENLKQLAHAGIQNQMITFSQLMDIYTTDSVASIRRKIQRSEAEMQQRQSKEAEQAQALQDSQIQAQSEEMQAARDHEQAGWDREDGRNTEDNDTKLVIAGMNLDDSSKRDHHNEDEHHSIEKLQQDAKKVDADIENKSKVTSETERHNKVTEGQKETELGIKRTQANKPAASSSSK